ncbi:MAG TPA: TIGR01620 family protein [Hyphomicrobiales bacterium]|nr:TIGR01620 family protein [Hyphomicrobiales bacterium]
MNEAPRKPIGFRLAEPDAAGRVALAPLAEIEPPEAPNDAAIVAAAAPRRGSFLVRLFWGSLGALVAILVGLAIDDMVAALFARRDWLGWAGLVVATVFGLAVVLLALREVAAVARLARIDALRDRAEAAIAADDRADATAIVSDLQSLYRAMPRTAQARALLRRQQGEIIDGADLVHLAERELMAPLDAEAARLVGAAARRVAMATTVMPRAVLDLAVVAAVGVRLIRGVAEIYGGRPGTFGFLRLLRHVLAHLAITGGMAAGQGLVEGLVGHGIAARLSARLGEGVINGVLTARVGVAAIAVCRPLPFSAVKAPTVRDVAGSLFERGEAP